MDRQTRVHACAECFRLRRKCIREHASGPCERCLSLEITCTPRLVFRSHGQNRNTKQGPIELEAFRSLQVTDPSKGMLETYAGAEAWVTAFRSLGLKEAPIFLDYFVHGLLYFAKDNKNAGYLHSSIALSLITGVNIDTDELARQPDTPQFREQREVVLQYFLDKFTAGSDCHFASVGVYGARNIQSCQRFRHIFGRHVHDQGYFEAGGFFKAWNRFVLDKKKLKELLSAYVLTSLRAKPWEAEEGIRVEASVSMKDVRIAGENGEVYKCDVLLDTLLSFRGKVCLGIVRFRPLKALDPQAAAKLARLPPPEVKFPDGIQLPPIVSELNLAQTEDGGLNEQQRSELEEFFVPEDIRDSSQASNSKLALDQNGCVGQSSQARRQRSFAYSQVVMPPLLPPISVGHSTQVVSSATLPGVSYAGPSQCDNSEQCEVNGHRPEKQREAMSSADARSPQLAQDQAPTGATRQPEITEELGWVPTGDRLWNKFSEM